MQNVTKTCRNVCARALYMHTKFDSPRVVFEHTFFIVKPTAVGWGFFIGEAFDWMPKKLISKQHVSQ